MEKQRMTVAGCKELQGIQLATATRNKRRCARPRNRDILDLWVWRGSRIRSCRRWGPDWTSTSKKTQADQIPISLTNAIVLQRYTCRWMFCDCRFGKLLRLTTSWLNKCTSWPMQAYMVSFIQLQQLMPSSCNRRDITLTHIFTHTTSNISTITHDKEKLCEWVCPYQAFSGSSSTTETEPQLSD